MDWVLVAGNTTLPAGCWRTFYTRRQGRPNPGPEGRHRLEPPNGCTFLKVMLRVLPGSPVLLPAVHTGIEGGEITAPSGHWPLNAERSSVVA